MKKIAGIRERSPMRLSIKLLVAALAATIGVAGFAGMAVAHTITINSQHTIDFTADVASDRFAGQVSSSSAACERGRSIVLYRMIGDASVPDQVVATASTDSSGVWSKGVGEARAGTYYAVAEKKVVQPPGHRHVCKVARSAALPVSPVLEGLSLDPDTILVDQESTGTVSLTVRAGADLGVSLESSDVAAASVPETVTVRRGQAQASFTITGEGVGSTTIKASLNGTSFTQTLTVDSDADGDGIPDSEDCAPNDPNPPGETQCFAPATPYQINQGLVSQGSGVWVRGLLVTAVAEDGSTAWAGVKDTDAGWEGPDYSAITLDLSGVSPAPSVGERVDVLGSSKELGVEASKVTVISSGETPVPREVTATAFSSEPNPEKYNAQLLRLNNVTLVSHTTDGGWLISENIAVGNRIIGALPTYDDGSSFASVAGIVDAFGASPVLLPRSSSDIVPSS